MLFVPVVRSLAGADNLQTMSFKEPGISRACGRKCFSLICKVSQRKSQTMQAMEAYLVPDAFDPANATLGIEKDASPTIRHIRTSGPELSGKTTLFTELLNLLGLHLFNIKSTGDTPLQIVINITEACSKDPRGLKSECRDLGQMAVGGSAPLIATKENPDHHMVEYDENKITRLLVITKRGWDRVISKALDVCNIGGGVMERDGVATAVHVTVNIVSSKSRLLLALGLR